MLLKTRYCKVSKDYYLKHWDIIFCDEKLQLILPEHILRAENKHDIDTVSEKKALQFYVKNWDWEVE